MSPPENGRITEQETVGVTKVHGDLSQEVVKITVDKLSLILYKHSTSIEQRKAWIAPLGIFVTIIVVLATSTFHNFIFPGAVWTATFIIGAIFTIIWLLKTGLKAIKSESIDDLVEKIKKQD